MQRNVNHEHNIQFPQVDEAKESLKDNEKFFIGLGVGFVFGILFRPRRTEVIIIEK